MLKKLNHSIHFVFQFKFHVNICHLLMLIASMHVQMKQEMAALVLLR